MEVYQNLKEYIELLNGNKVEYLIAGGYASSFHSRPGYTKDIDIRVNPTKTNAKRVIKALNQFGFENIDISISDLTNKDQFIQLGYAPIRIDLIAGMMGIKFSDAYRNIATGTYGNVKDLKYFSAEDLITNKTLSGRKQDLFNVYWIEKYCTKKRKK